VYLRFPNELLFGFVFFFLSAVGKLCTPSRSGVISHVCLHLTRMSSVINTPTGITPWKPPHQNGTMLWTFYTCEKAGQLGEKTQFKLSPNKIDRCSTGTTTEMPR